MSKKNKLLILGTLLMFLASYQFALKRTFLTYGEYRDNQDTVEAVSNVPRLLTVLTQKEQVLNKQLEDLNLNNSSLQSNLLKFLSEKAEIHLVKVIAFNAPVVHRDENREIETFIFSLEGGYTDVLKMVNALENHGGFGAVTHVGLKKKKDYKSKRSYLQAEIFLEQVH